jgi:hypothetical protein
MVIIFIVISIIYSAASKIPKFICRDLMGSVQDGAKLSFLRRQLPEGLENSALVPTRKVRRDALLTTAGECGLPRSRSPIDAALKVMGGKYKVAGPISGCLRSFHFLVYVYGCLSPSSFPRSPLRPRLTWLVGPRFWLIRLSLISPIASRPISMVTSS